YPGDSLLNMRIRRHIELLAILLLLIASLALGQGRTEDGAHELQLWMGGGHAVTGKTSKTSEIGVWNLGLRYGWIITRPHGPGFLKGRLEYAVDAVPLFLVFQPANTAYGVGVNPLGLKWNLELRYLHISNAGLAVPNPGINTIQVRVGVGAFRSETRSRSQRNRP